MSLSPELLIATLNAAPPEYVWLLMLIVCFGTILLMLRLFGEVGLQVYVVVAIIGANIQVLKVVKFAVYSEPVALGTVLFATTYLCTDILTEHYGRAAAQKTVLLGFAAYLFSTVVMILTLGFPPLTVEQAGESMTWALPLHDHIAALFTPAPALFAAGMTAYLASQFHDIWLYNLVRRATGGRWLWLRNNASTAVSSLIDNTIFSVLAWVVFAADPLPWSTVIFTFILGTYWLRLLVAAMDTPILYLSRLVRPATSLAI
jgi:hypothetical protein